MAEFGQDFDFGQSSSDRRRILVLHEQEGRMGKAIGSLTAVVCAMCLLAAPAAANRDRNPRRLRRPPVLHGRVERPVRGDFAPRGPKDGAAKLRDADHRGIKAALDMMP